MNSQNNLPPFYVGQKVICIDAKKRIPDWPIALKEGVIYTVIAITYKTDEGIGLVLKEVDAFKPEWGFFADRFKPLSKQPFSEITYSKVSEKEKCQI